MSDCQRARMLGGIAAVAIGAVFAGQVASAQAATTDCRASAARATVPPQATSEPVIANPSGSPCVTETQQAAGTQPLGGATVRIHAR